MGNYTYKDLQVEVDRMNEKHKLSDKTTVKFSVDRAYGGNKVVLVNKYGGGTRDVTYGFQSAKETAYDLFKADSRGLKENVKYAIRDEKEMRKRGKR